MDDIVGPIIVGILFIGLPWLIFHYITKWKTAATLSGSDEKLLDELHEMARRLDDRLCTIERIMTAENPEWRQTCLPDSTTDSLSDEISRLRSRTGDTL
ncbi:MAG TPA: envelope stress response membrane protein PspB [Sphingomicrobium sp.]|nr:envelope stress response membrane protein PspB [Sphingomicrobium sp.]